MSVEDIISLLQKTSTELNHIHKSDAWLALCESPQAHPEIEQIMGDAQHYITELRLRVGQAIEPTLTPQASEQIASLFAGWEDSPV